MKRQIYTLAVLVLCVLLVAVAVHTTQANAAVVESSEQPLVGLATKAPTSQPTTEAALIETALLTSPDACGSLCFWQFQPGQGTLRQFKQLVVGIFTEVDPTLKSSPILTGLFDKGVALHTSIRDTTGLTLDSTVDYVYIRLDPAAAQAAGINVSRFSPAALVSKFGAPDDAFLLFNPDHPLTYRLILLYESRSVLYVIRGTFENSKACLTLNGVNNLTLYRFATASAAKQFISLTAGSTGLPPSITTNTQQQPGDFVQMAQKPTTNCLTLR